MYGCSCISCDGEVVVVNTVAELGVPRRFCVCTVVTEFEVCTNALVVVTPTRQWLVDVTAGVVSVLLRWEC